VIKITKRPKGPAVAGVVVVRRSNNIESVARVTMVNVRCNTLLLYYPLKVNARPPGLGVQTLISELGALVRM